MCKMKSGIILKDRVFVPDYDSHTEMLNELKIEDTTKNAERLFVRAELIPTNNDVFSSIENWKFNVDQDIVPDWFVKEVEKDRMIKAVKEWAKDHIHIGIDDLEISAGSNHYIKDCKNIKVCGNATVNEVCDNATVNEVYGNATVNKVCGNATVEWVYGNATVNKVCGNATVEWVYGNATVNEVCGNATVETAKGMSMISGSQYGWSKKDKLILSENATFKDCQAKVIYQSGDWKLVEVKGER